MAAATLIIAALGGAIAAGTVAGQLPDVFSPDGGAAGRVSRAARIRGALAHTTAVIPPQRQREWKEWSMLPTLEGGARAGYIHVERVEGGEGEWYGAPMYMVTASDGMPAVPIWNPHALDY